MSHVTGHRSQVTGNMSQVTCHRFQVRALLGVRYFSFAHSSVLVPYLLMSILVINLHTRDWPTEILSKKGGLIKITRIYLYK